MGEPADSSSELWRERLQRFRTYAPRAMLFAAGICAALIALLLYRVLAPAPSQLTTREVDESIAQALASVTPPAALSARVYQVIRPSLVFIQTQLSDEDSDGGYGVGSGVVVNTSGDILTSLHVVADAQDIQVTFADGTQSNAQVTVEQPENDTAVLRAIQPPPLLLPAILGNPNATRVGDEAFVVGNPLGLYSSMSAGVISGFGRSFQPIDSDTVLHDLIQFDAAVNPGWARSSPRWPLFCR